MAQVSSGSFTTTSSEGRSLTFNWSVDSTSISGNYKKIYWSLVGSGSYTGYVMGGNFKVVIDGETVYEKGEDYRIKLWQGTVVASGYKILYHNNEGNKSFSASVEAGVWAYARNVSGSGKWDLPTIPRYATSNQSLNSKTENSITMNWSSDKTIDYLWYSKDNGSTWTGVDVPDGTSGSYIISSLTHNTTYNIKTRVRRKDTQLTTDSSALAVTTYNYPHCTDTPNFTIGDALTLTFYNPLGRRISVVGYSKTSGEQIFTGSTTGTSLKGFNDADSVNSQYSSIPNAKSSQYKVVVTYENFSMTRDAGNTYSIKGTEVPTINGFDYIDNNSSTVEVTGDETKIVQNKSILLVRFHEATPNYGAGKISQYYIECNGKKANGDKAGAYNLNTIDSSTDVDLTLTVVDSRGLSSSKTIKVSMVSYSEPSFIASVKRLNNYEDETYLKVDASIASVNGKNKIEVLQYRYKLEGGSYGEDYYSIEDNKTYTLDLDKNNIYIFEVILKDSLGSIKVDTVALNKGVFPLFIDTVLNSVGINCFPKETNSLEVNNLNVYKVANNVNKAMKNILLGGNDGLKIVVKSFGGTDKIPIIVAGTDNASMIPVFTIIHMRSGSGFGHINLGLDSTVTRDGNALHINATQWSFFNVIVPLGCEIELSNSAL